MGNHAMLCFIFTCSHVCFLVICLEWFYWTSAISNCTYQADNDSNIVWLCFPFPPHYFLYSVINLLPILLSIFMYSCIPLYPYSHSYFSISCISLSPQLTRPHTRKKWVSVWSYGTTEMFSLFVCNINKHAYMRTFLHVCCHFRVKFYWNLLQCANGSRGDKSMEIMAWRADKQENINY